MADLSITTTQVATVSGSTVVNNQNNAGYAATVGDAVYLDTSNLWQQLKNDTLIHSGNGTTVGIALNSVAASGQPLTVATGGKLTLGAGAAPAAGAYYVASVNSAKIAPSSDTLTGAYVTLLGIGIGSNQIQIMVNATGITHA